MNPLPGFSSQITPHRQQTETEGRLAAFTPALLAEALRGEL